MNHGGRPYSRLMKREHDRAVALGSPALLVYVALCRLQSDARTEEKGGFRAGATRISRLCGLSPRTVQTYLPRLAADGLIAIQSGCHVVDQHHYEENKITLLGNAIAAAGSANDPVPICGLYVVDKKKRKRKAVERFSPGELPLPHGEQFASAWREFCTHRGELGCKLTPSASKRILNELGGVEESEAVRATNEAISRSWRKPFPRASGISVSVLGRTPTRLVL